MDQPKSWIVGLGATAAAAAVGFWAWRQKQSQGQDDEAQATLAAVLAVFEGEERSEVLRSLTPRQNDAALRAMREQLPKSDSPPVSPPGSPKSSGQVRVGTGGSLLDFLREIPKTDLHVHLDGSLRVRTLIELARENGVELPS